MTKFFGLLEVFYACVMCALCFLHEWVPTTYTSAL